MILAIQENNLVQITYVFSVLISVSVVFVGVQWRAYFAVTEASWVVIGRSVELLLHFRVAELYCGQYL